MTLIEQIQAHKNKALVTAVLAILGVMGLYEPDTAPEAPVVEQLEETASQLQACKDKAQADFVDDKKARRAAIKECRAKFVSQVDSPAPDGPQQDCVALAKSAFEAGTAQATAKFIAECGAMEVPQ